MKNIKSYLMFFHKQLAKNSASSKGHGVVTLEGAEEAAMEEGLLDAPEEELDMNSVKIQLRQVESSSTLEGDQEQEISLTGNTRSVKPEI